MKKLLIFGIFLLLTLSLRAQNGYFLFIQSENNQPFYVQSEGKSLSSSAAGHLIMASLRDTVYRLTVGFPKNQFPEQVFEIRMNRKDAGYQLKNTGADEWVLFNWQTSQPIKALQTERKKQAISYGDVKKGDVFSVLMAGLVNDSAVLYTSIAKADPIGENSTSAISDSPVANSVVKQDEKPDLDAAVAKPDTTAIKPAITKAEGPLQKDTSRLQAIAVKPEEPSRNDTPIVKMETAQGKDPKAPDSSVAKSVPPKSDSVIKTGADTVTAELAGQPGTGKKNTTDTNSRASSQTPVAAVDNEVTKAKVQDVTDTPVSDQKGNIKLKPLIIWFSETETSSGIELVYFDMSVAEKTDTIKILIPKEDVVVENNTKGSNTDKENKTDARQETKEDEKSGAGKFFGKLFGKKNDSTSANSSGKNKNKSKESSITVTTVEQNKRVDTAYVASKKTPVRKEEAATDNDEATKKAEKKESGSFMQKIFGKNNDKASVRDTTQAGSVTVKVTTVENKSSDSIDSPGKQKNDVAEVEKLKKAQETEETTSTQRFFGKLFGKKTSNVAKDTIATTPSKKVTTVPDASAGETKEQGTVAVTNSDCQQFASDSELDKLRVKMLGERDIDAQVTEARKVFKVKCLSTKQVRSLGSVFRTDEGKYKLFDAAYPYVSDTQNFIELVELLTEEYYINRFKAMVRS